MTNSHDKEGNNSETVARYSYPKNLLITRSSGIGNDASWDFKQCEAFGWKGQYDFNIIFNIGKAPNEIKSDNPNFYVIFASNTKILILFETDCCTNNRYHSNKEFHNNPSLLQ